jgi:RNA polymerase sigma factor (TIGR02999 family)
MEEARHKVTTLIEALTNGDKQAGSDLLPIVYDELRHLAGARMANLVPGQTLQPTALVHEAYLKLVGRQDPGWNGRGHFFGAAARAMREILVDGVRSKMRHKRGGGRRRVELDEAALIDTGFKVPGDDLLALDAALTRLEASHKQAAEIVMLSYFAGLTHEHIADTLEVSTRTVERGWRFARAWLHNQLGSSLGEPTLVKGSVDG